MVRTALATLDPANDDRPLIMIVDSTPSQRNDWAKACNVTGFRHHFVAPYAASRIARNNFRARRGPIAGIIIDHDLSGEFPSPATGPHSVTAFLLALMETNYCGPLATAGLQTGHVQIPNIWSGDIRIALLGETAKQLACPYQADIDDYWTPFDQLSWMKHRLGR